MFSTSYFEKGRVYGYGPKFLRIRGKILYRLSEISGVQSLRQITQCTHDVACRQSEARALQGIVNFTARWGIVIYPGSVGLGVCLKSFAQL